MVIALKVQVFILKTQADYLLFYEEKRVQPIILRNRI